MDKIALAADHAGYLLKVPVQDFLIQLGYEVIDFGTDSPSPVDYPDFAKAVGEAIASGKAHSGIVICGSGVGASIAANKIPGVRAAICHDTFSARQGKEDDDMNVLCLGARVIGSGLAFEVISAFLKAKFSRLERHQRRLNKVLSLEKKYSK